MRGWTIAISALSIVIGPLVGAAGARSDEAAHVYLAADAERMTCR